MKPGAVIIRQLALAITDTAMVASACFLAYLLRFHSGWIPLVHEVPPVSWYTRPLGLVVLVYFLFFRSVGLYAVQHVRYPRVNAGAVAHGTTLASIMLMALSFLYRDTSYSRAVLALAWGCSTVLVTIGRFGICWWLGRTQPKVRLLIIGSGPTAAQLIHRIRGQDSHEIIGVIDAHDLPKFLTKRATDEVIVAEPSLSRDQVMTLINQCEQALVEFRMVPDTLELLTTQSGAHHLDGIPLLGLRQPPLMDPWNRFLKRAMDIAVSLLGIAAAALPMFLIAWWIKWDSPGPVFYVQKRVGQDGRHFTMVKFRTMQVSAERATGPVWATPDDARRTRVGRILRRWNLDELPQLLNVLRGDMSLVGPRPERPHFVRQFRQDIPRYMARHRIRSGITGWAQIHGLRGDTSIEERTKYDLYYLENWSLWLDCKILLHSLAAVKNAY